MITRLFTPCFATIALVASANAAAIQVHVSDIIEAPVRSIAETAAGTNLTLTIENSSKAIASVREGRTELAVVAIPDGVKQPDDLHCVPFAYEVASIVVNNGNPLKETDLRSLTDALRSASQNGGKWGALGLNDMWGEKNISIFLPDSSMGMTLQLLRSQTVHNDDFRKDIVFLNGKEDPNVLVREQSECLLVIRGVKIPTSGRALNLSVKSGADAFAYPPSESSVFYGDYPLRLPFYIVTRKDAGEMTAAFESLLLSDDAAAKLEAAGYVPVPKRERQSAQ